MLQRLELVCQSAWWCVKCVFVVPIASVLIPIQPSRMVILRTLIVIIHGSWKFQLTLRPRVDLGLDGHQQSFSPLAGGWGGVAIVIQGFRNHLVRALDTLV